MASSPLDPVTMPKVDEQPSLSPLEPVAEDGMDPDAPLSANGSANGQPANGKRFRPAPAKTFQCRGYGECRMVFSRSEHLARHIRKHTGERPFTCHCGKQFSRLDNLRQHAQTVHADKADQNERMMRELTSLHASMAAANKATQQRGKRASNGSANGGVVPQVKQEEEGAMPQLYRPGTTTTGYESSFGQWPQAELVDRPNRTQPSPFSPVESTGSPGPHDYHRSQRSSPLSPQQFTDGQQLPRQRTSPPALSMFPPAHDHAQDIWGANQTYNTFHHPHPQQQLSAPPQTSTLPFHSTLHRSTSRQSLASAPSPPETTRTTTSTQPGDFLQPERRADPSLGDSPSWNSAIQTPTQIPIEPFYPRPQDTHQPQRPLGRGQQPSSSRVPLALHSPMAPPPPSHSYAQEIARHQEAQMRQLQQAQVQHGQHMGNGHHQQQQQRALPQHHRTHYEDPAGTYPLSYPPHHSQRQPQAHHQQAFYGLEQAMYAPTTDDQRSLLSTPPL